MKQLQNIKQNNPVAFAAMMGLCSILAVIVSGIVVGVIIGLTGKDDVSYYLMALLQDVLASVLILGLAVFSGTTYTLKRRGCGLGHALLVGAYPAVFIMTIAASMTAFGAAEGGVLLPVWEIALFFLAMLSIGIAEELAFRGIVAERLLHHFGASKKGVWSATVISGLIFGLAHIMNIFGMEPLGVLVQTLVACVLGMLFAAIYFRTGNLWICVFLHAGLNASSLMASGLYGIGDLETLVSGFSFVNLTPCITYGLPVFFLLRVSKLPEVAFWFDLPMAEQK